MLRCGSVLWYILRCGSVQFSAIRNRTVRFGAVFRYGKSYGAVRCCDMSYGAVRHVSPLNVFSTVQIHSPLGKPHNTVFSPRCTVWVKLPKPRFLTVLALFLGARTKPLFFYCFSTMHRINLINCTNRRVRMVFWRFFISSQSHQQQQVLGALKNRSNKKSIRTYHTKKYVKIPQGARCVPWYIMCGLVCMKCRMHGS